jgi:HK97 family phage portal protein
MLHALVYGNGYAEIQRLGNGRPYKLHLLEPRSTQAKRDVEKNLYYSTSSHITGDTILPAGNVLHIAGLGYDGISGYNMVRLMRQAIGLSMAGETFAADFFSNGSESGGTIEVPGRLEDDLAVERLRNRWEGRHQGAGRRHRVAVLEEGAVYKPTGTEPEKSQLLETRKFQVTDTSRPWRVPPHKIGDYSQAHLANIEASNLDYLQTALMGWLVTIEQQYDLKLFSRQEWLDGYRFEHDFSALLRSDIVSRFNAYKSALGDGWLSRNEVRKREHLNPIPTAKATSPGDAYYVQMQMVQLGTTPTPPPAAAPPVKPTEPDGDETDTESRAAEQRGGDFIQGPDGKMQGSAPSADSSDKGEHIGEVVHSTDEVSHKDGSKASFTVEKLDDSYVKQGEKPYVIQAHITEPDGQKYSESAGKSFKNLDMDKKQADHSAKVFKKYGVT